MRNTLRDAVNFANKCIEWDIRPYQLAELINLREKAARALERKHNRPYNAKPACDRFEEVAKRLGFTVRWDGGLYPGVQRNGEDIWLPYIS